MSHQLYRASDFYRIARGKKPAARMLIHVALGLSILLVWASITPINDSVAHLAKIVPRNEVTNAKDGSLNMSTPLSGKVSAVLVSERQKVLKDEVLIRLDTQELQIRRDGEREKIKNLDLEIKAKIQQNELATSTYKTQKAELKAQLEAEKSRVKTLALERSIKIKSANSELKRVTKELSRFKKLIVQKAISRSELDMAETDYLRAKESLALASLPIEESRVAELSSRIESIESGHLETLHEIETTRLVLESRIASAHSEIELLEMRIEQSSIVSPIDGHVSACNISEGDWVSPGMLDVTVSQTGFIAEALLPSQLIGDVKPGDEAKIMIDGIDWMLYGSISATVSSISTELCHEEVPLGDGATQVVDGYRVLFEIESHDFKKWNSIRIGMTGLVQIETGEKNLAVHLLEKAVGESLFKSR